MTDTKYVMVPVKPTDEMYRAVRDWSQKAFGKPIGNPAASGCWHTMLAAAPAAPDEPLDREAIRNEALEEGIAVLESFALQIEDMGIRTGAMCSVDQLCALKSQPAQPVENESEIILNWLIRHMSSSELQRIGIPCPPGCTIDDIKQSMKQWKPSDKPAQPSDSQAEPSDNPWVWMVEFERVTPPHDSS